MKNDDYQLSADYSIAIKELQNLSFNLNCLTIEYFSEQILNCLEKLYGDIPIQITLTKCSPPIPGFEGSVSIKRSRNLD